MAVNEKLPILLNYGRALKSCFEMTRDEFKKASASIKKRAREKAFSKGLPVYVIRKEKIVAEFPDGHVVVIDAK